MDALKPSGRSCDVCGEPAVYASSHVDELYCRDCGHYYSGLDHGKAAMARAQLSEAIQMLIVAGLTHEAVAYVCESELEGQVRPVGPESQYPEDPRPWVRMMRPINEEET